MQSKKMEITQQFTLPAVSGRAKGVGNCGGNYLDILHKHINRCMHVYAQLGDVCTHTLYAVCACVCVCIYACVHIRIHVHI